MIQKKCKFLHQPQCRFSHASLCFMLTVHAKGVVCHPRARSRHQKVKQLKWDKKWIVWGYIFSSFLFSLSFIVCYTIQALKPNPLHPCHVTGYLPPHFSIKFALDVFWPSSLCLKAPAEVAPISEQVHATPAGRVISSKFSGCTAWSKHPRPNHSHGHPVGSSCLCWELFAEIVWLNWALVTTALWCNPWGWDSSGDITGFGFSSLTGCFRIIWALFG